MSNHTFSNVKLVGMHFRGAWAKDYAAALQPGDALTLEREADNQYDENAIKVLTTGENPQHLAYVEKDSAAWIAGPMDEGIEFTVTIERVESYKNTVYPFATIEPADAED